MARTCEITGKKVAVANHVSHANNRTKRVQRPNLHTRAFTSSLLGRTVRLDVSAAAIRTVDKHGGFDNFVTTIKNRRVLEFSPALKKLRKQMLKKKDALPAAPQTEAAEA